MDVGDDAAPLSGNVSVIAKLAAESAGQEFVRPMVAAVLQMRQLGLGALMEEGLTVAITTRVVVRSAQVGQVYLTLPLDVHRTCS